MKKYLIYVCVLLLTWAYTYWQSTIEYSPNGNPDSNITMKYDLSESKRLQIDKVFENLLKRLNSKSVEYKMQKLNKLQIQIDILISKTTKNSKLNILYYLNELISNEITCSNLDVESVKKDKSESNNKVKMETVYIKGIYNFSWNNYIKTTSINFYTWDVAAKVIEEKDPKLCAWLKQEFNEEKCYPMNDYYIVNNKIEKDLLLSNNVKIIMQTYSIIDWKISWNEEISFSDFVSAIKEWKTIWDFDMSYDFIPFHLEISEGKIIKITEQYIP